MAKLVITNLSNTSVYDKIDETMNLGTIIDNYVPQPLDKLVIYTGAFGHVNDVKYFAGDLMLKYSLGEALGCESMEPYVGVGLGNTWMDTSSWMTSNASLGMNYWFSDVWGLTAQVDYKINMSENGRGETSMLDEGGTMRYSIGVSMKFGGSEK